MAFDIFISFKATDNGRTTDDSEYAEELYNSLSARGYRVFFSNASLIERGNSDYQLEIDEALESARLLIVVSTKLNYINSGWLEYEWKTFHADILSGVKRNSQIITLTSGVDTREMPRVLRYAQNFPMDDSERFMCFIDAFFGREVSDSCPLPSPIPSPSAEAADHTFYDSGWDGEFELLRVASSNSYDFDMEAIAKAKKLRGFKNYNVLVVGCAYGFIAESRFGLDDDAANVVCIDFNDQVIERARELYSAYPHMSFHRVDVESETYVADVRQIMQELEIEQFHIIFASGLLKYLNNPAAFVRKTRKLLSDETLFMIRGGDDGSKIAYPDDHGTLRHIIDESAVIKGMPDYSTGRRIMSYLNCGGFRVEDIMCHMKHTAEMTFEQKEDLFCESFVSRMNLAKNKLRATNDKKETERLKKFMKAIEELENVFYDRNMWYSEFDFFCIAGKG